MSQINIKHHRTEVGELVLASFEGKLCLLGFGHERTIGAVDRRITKRLDAVCVEQDDEVLKATREQIDQYLSGMRRGFDLPLLPVGTAFEKSVWNALLKVPYGSTSTYKRVAEDIGNPKAVRAVGSACKANPIAIIVPCHRIIGSNGALVGYGGGLPLKERLLKLEQSNTAWYDGQVDAARETDRSMPGYQVRRVT